MAITLRNVKGTELSHAEMDTNFKSFYYSSSLNGNTLTLHTTGSTAHSHDIPDTNIANTNLVLSGDRTVNLNGNDLAFNVNGGEAFRISGSSTSQIQITDLPNTETPVVLGYNTTSGQFSYYSTGSFGSGGGGSIDTGSFYVSSSVSLNTITFTQGDGTTESVTIDTGSGGGGSVDTGSFYVSSSINAAGNVITFNQGDGTTESVTVNTATRYDVTNKSTAGPGTKRPSQVIAGGSKIASGDTSAVIRIPEIADKKLGDDVFITATFVNLPQDMTMAIRASGSAASIPQTIDSSGQIDFSAGGATLLTDAYFMYHIIYTD